MALPFDRQIRFGMGAIWEYSESLTVGFNFQFADLGRAPVKNNIVLGSYDTKALFLFGLNLNFKNLPWAEWGKLVEQRSL